MASASVGNLASAIQQIQISPAAAAAGPSRANSDPTGSKKDVEKAVAAAKAGISRREHEGEKGVKILGEIARGATARVSKLEVRSPTDSLPDRFMARKEFFPEYCQNPDSINTIGFTPARKTPDGEEIAPRRPAEANALLFKEAPGLAHTSAIAAQTPDGRETIYTDFDTLPEEGMLTSIDMELLQGSELFPAIVAAGQFDAARTKDYMKQAAEALSSMHGYKHPVLHRDLKPENMYLDVNNKGNLVDGKWERPYGTIKITDWGMSIKTANGRAKTSCGSPHYAAPEIINGKKYDTSVDVYSLGIVAYAMKSGRLVFDNDHLPTLLGSIASYGTSGKSLAEYFHPDAMRKQLSDLRSKYNHYCTTGDNYNADRIKREYNQLTQLINNKVFENLEEIKKDDPILYNVILLATHSDPAKRPSATYVALALDGKIPLADLKADLAD